ncbi:MAG TPA: hypothetical protein VGY31_13755 [Terriglobia bacterium]|nr:hypothetical protein [Terriglobia bacterium]
MAARLCHSKPGLCVEAEHGVGLMEMLVAIVITLFMLGAAFTFFDSMESMTEEVSVMASVNEGLRGAADLITKDIYTAGTSIPSGGISIPWDGVSANSLVKRPGSSGYFFPVNNGNLAVITPGYQLSGQIGGTALYSDEVTLITVNENWVGSQPPPLQISSMTSAKSTGYTVNVTIPTPGCTTSATPPVFDCTLGANGYNLNPSGGDLLMFTTTGGAHVLGLTTSVDTTNNIIYFGADLLNLNQVCGSAATCVGSIDSLSNNGSGTYTGTGGYPSGMTLTKIDMITYYVDTSDTNHPCVKLGTNPYQSCPLVRQLGASTPTEVAFGIDNLQFTYDMTTGASTNCTGGSTEPSSCASFQPNQIGMVHLFISGISQNVLRKSQRYYANTFDTSVDVRNLEYVNQFP